MVLVRRLKLSTARAVQGGMLYVQRLAVAVGLTLCSACPSAAGTGSETPVGAQRDTAAPKVFSEFVCPYDSEEDLSKALASRAQELGVGGDYDYLRLSRIHVEARNKQAELGAPCQGAADPQGCEEQLKQLESAVEAVPGPHRYQYAGRIYAVTTRRDEVRVWVDAAGLRSLFGEIDTPAKAWAMVQAAEEIGPHGCKSGGGWFPHVSGYRRVPGGFEIRVVETVSPCRPLEVLEGTFFVGSDGEVTLRGWRPLERNSERCVVN